MPPYCISEAELDQVYNAIGDAADQVDRWAAS
jgi:adenosylmethionine-8-amino-7-oxononanoate aminotransferase